MSSRGPPVRRLEHRVLDALRDAVGGQAGAALQQLGEVAVAEELLAARPDLGDAVGVEHDQLARREVDRRRRRGPARRPRRAASRACRPARRRRSARSTSGSGWPPQQSSIRSAVGAHLEVAVGDGAEAPVVARLAQRAVQQREHGARPRLVCGGGAQRVARQRGHRRGLGPLAADVADQGRDRRAARAEEVVEVAADLDPLARGDEARPPRRARGRPGARAGAASAAAPGRCGARACRPATCAIATEASWPSWARIASSRGVNSRSGPSATSSMPSGRPALRSITPTGGPIAPPGARRPATRRSARARTDRRRGSRSSRARAPSICARRLDRELERLLGRHRRVDPHRGLRERVELVHVLVLEPRRPPGPRDSRGGRSRTSRAPRRRTRPAASSSSARRAGSSSSRSASCATRVVRLGEVEHAQLRARPPRGRARRRSPARARRDGRAMRGRLRCSARATRAAQRWRKARARPCTRQLMRSRPARLRRQVAASTLSSSSRSSIASRRCPPWRSAAVPAGHAGPAHVSTRCSPAARPGSSMRVELLVAGAQRDRERAGRRAAGVAQRHGVQSTALLGPRRDLDQRGGEVGPQVGLAADPRRQARAREHRRPRCRASGSARRAVRGRRGEVLARSWRRSSGARRGRTSATGRGRARRRGASRRSSTSRTCSEKRTCIRSLPVCGRTRASNVAARCCGSSALSHASSFTLSAAAAAGDPSRSKALISRTRRMARPLTLRGRPELRPRAQVTW